MHACYMILTYLRGGLSTCSVMWVSVLYVFLKFIYFSCNRAKVSFKNFKNYGYYLLFLELRTPAQLFLGVRFCCACLQLWLLV